MADNKQKFNDFPQGSKLHVKLPTEPIVMYRLLDTYNPITKKYHLRTQTIPQVDFVSDPETEETHHIALIAREKPNGEYELADVTFLEQQMCIVRLNMKSAIDQKTFRFMEITNYNSSNPNRDMTITPYFERITNSTDYDYSSSHRKQVKEAYNIVDQMSIEDIRSFVKDHPTIVLKSQDDKTLRNAIEEFAELFPGAVISATTVGLAAFEEEVQRLIDDEVISYDKDAATWNLKSGEPVIKLSKTFTKNPFAELVKILLKQESVLARIRASAVPEVKEEVKAPVQPKKVK